MAFGNGFGGKKEIAHWYGFVNRKKAHRIADKPRFIKKIHASRGAPAAGPPAACLAARRGRGRSAGWCTGRARSTPRACGAICAPAASAAAKRSATRCCDAAIAETGKGATELIADLVRSRREGGRLVVDVRRLGGRGSGARARQGHHLSHAASRLLRDRRRSTCAQRLPLTALYRPPKLRWLEPLMLAGRSRWQAVLAPANLRGVRMLYRALQQGGQVGLAARPGAGRRRGRVGGFLRTARLHHDARDAPAAGDRRGGRSWASRSACRTGAATACISRNCPRQSWTKPRSNRAIEALVRRCPEQYLWSYNRYKVPAGAAATSEGGSGRRRAEGG